MQSEGVGGKRSKARYLLLYVNDEEEEEARTVSAKHTCRCENYGKAPNE